VLYVGQPSRARLQAGCSSGLTAIAQGTGVGVTVRVWVGVGVCVGTGVWVGARVAVAVFAAEPCSSERQGPVWTWARELGSPWAGADA